MNLCDPFSYLYKLYDTLGRSGANIIQIPKELPGLIYNK